MTRRHFHAIAGPALLLTFAACSDQLDEPLSPISVDYSMSIEGAEVPPRSQDSPGGFVDMSDKVLWEYISFSDGVAVVGLKRPGVNRGVWRGQLLLDRSQWREARHAVISQKGITLISADTLLPTVIVKIDGIAALQAIRKLPIVDYVQPETVASGLGGMWAESGGCDYGSVWTGATPISSGDLLSASAREMGIEDAWRRSNGEGVTIGLIDTGIADTQPEIGDWARFTSGDSGGRTIDYLYTSNTGTPWSTCGHGTKMAGVIAAPRNGSSVIGVAWKANLISVHHADGVANVSSDSSSATATIAGVAALVWSRYPSMSRDSLWEHLRWSGRLYPDRDGNRGWGIVNAHKALGGMYRVLIEPTVLDLQECRYAVLQPTAIAYGGDGPFQYDWSHGPTTRTVTDTLWFGQSVLRSVEITDQSEGTTRTASKRIYGPEFCGEDPI